MTSKALDAGRRDSSLDGWRGLAIVGVLFAHFVTSDALNLGRFGVEMFFVLSGMLMAEILFVKQTPIGVFFARRFARIYPALFVFATLLFLFTSTTGIGTISWQAYLSAVTLTANYVSVLWHRTYDYDHIWSLCIEQHAYLVLGVVAALGRRTGVSPVLMIAVLAAAGIVNGAIDTWVFGWKYNLVYWRTDVRGASILIGAVAFMMIRDPARPAWLRAPLASPVCGAIALLLNLRMVPDPVKYSVGTVLVAICAATVAQAPAWYKGVLESRALVVIGLVSYSIYLWQEPFNEIEDPNLRLKMLPVALVCGILSYHLVEKPARIALNRLTRGRPRVVPA